MCQKTELQTDIFQLQVPLIQAYLNRFGKIRNPLHSLPPINICTDLRKQKAAGKTLNVKYPLS